MENKEDLKAEEALKPAKAKEKVLKPAKVYEKKKTEEPKAVIYMGPAVPGNILTPGKIYKKLPGYVLDFISKNPVIGKLIIDVEKLAEFKRNVEIKGTAEYRLYSESVKIINEGGLV